MILFGIFSNDKAREDPLETINREPYAAGKFYTGHTAGLRAGLDKLFQNAISKSIEHIRAIIVPHAGYSYSGQVAASGFNQIDPEAEYENIFIIASSHRMTYDGASVYFRGDYLTPLGKVKVNRQLAKELHDNNKVFLFSDKAHMDEHSLEVQLPFLQYHLKKPFKIVPIIIGVKDQKECGDIAEALQPYFNEKNLFVISTDFSHYPSYEDACEVDEKTANAITKNDLNGLRSVLAENRKENIPDLATSLCGWSSVYTLLHLTEGRSNIKYQKIQYMNSGDQDYGDKSKVVGYHAIAVYEKKNEGDEDFSINTDEKKKLLEIARDSIAHYLQFGTKPDIDTIGLSRVLLQPGGAFVSLYKENKLCGCIGRFSTTNPLYKVVSDMAIAAATTDSRFDPVSLSEVNHIDAEISILTPLMKVYSIDEIEIGRHGIYIRKGCLSGTFLPQVAVKSGWSREEFLGHCAKEKARMGWDGWKNAEIYTYEAIVFNEAEML